MKYVITEHKSNEEKNEIQKQGLYCYDLRMSDEQTEIATIEKSVLVNRVGSVITDEPINFGKNDFIDYKQFIKSNESVNLGELKDDKINFISFYLGYSLLNEQLKKSSSPECDTAYKFCSYLAHDFMKSNKYSENLEDIREWIVKDTDNIMQDMEIFYKENSSFKVIYDDIYYFTFVIGYDLLNAAFTKTNVKDVNIIYKFSKQLAQKYMDSEYFKDLNHSAYTMLEKYINDNKDIIKSQFFHFAGLDNKEIIKVGKRRDTPVALVKNVFSDSTEEYIIAFYYELRETKIDWGYGYYYNQNIQKAEKDFSKVLQGGNLDKTFEETDKKELIVKFIGIDSWDRPVYKDKKGNLYKDVNLGMGEISLCTSANNQFEGEPDTPINDEYKIKVVDSFKDKKKNNEIR